MTTHCVIVFVCKRNKTTCPQTKVEQNCQFEWFNETKTRLTGWLAAVMCSFLIVTAWGCHTAFQSQALLKFLRVFKLEFLMTCLTVNLEILTSEIKWNTPLASLHWPLVLERPAHNTSTNPFYKKLYRAFTALLLVAEGWLLTVTRIHYNLRGEVFEVIKKDKQKKPKLIITIRNTTNLMNSNNSLKPNRAKQNSSTAACTGQGGNRHVPLSCFCLFLISDVWIASLSSVNT